MRHTSSNDKRNKHPYLLKGFWDKIENKFWLTNKVNYNVKAYEEIKGSFEKTEE